MKTMNIKRLILFAMVAVMAAACADYLEPYPNGDRSRDDIWAYQDMAQGLIGQCYDNMSRNYNNNEGAYFDCISDDAVRTSTTDNLTRHATEIGRAHV